MESIWLKDYVEWNLPQINKDIKTPVLIIGGGIAGLMCAYECMKNNIKFILVDSKKLARGVSAYTTAQVSAAHGMLLDDIQKKHDKDKALEYFASQLYGLEIIKNIIKKENIKCDYKEESTIFCAKDKNNINILKKQYKLNRSHYNKMKWLTNITDIFKRNKGVEYQNQFIFNPMKYMMGIINILIKNDAKLYENSQVTQIDRKDNLYKVIINDKHTITTNKIIMACHYPFLNPDNLYFAKIYQSKSYAIAFKTKYKLSANYVSLDPPYFYIRTYDKSTLIIGGSDHYTGINNDINQCYNILIKQIYAIDKKAEIINKWFTQDCITLDSLPFVGQYSKKNPNILLVTGFQKWGFTNSHVAAKNILKMLANEESDSLYRTNRNTLGKDLKSTFRMIAHSINGLVISKLNIPKYDLNNIPIDSGKVINIDGQGILVYRDNKNKFIFLKNKCTHMGCSLIWNDVDKVWESKCHGSIFNKYGKVIYGPAIKDLEQIKL